MRGYGLLKLKEDNNLVLPWVIDSEMKDIPCLKIDIENRRITLNLLSEVENKINELIEVYIVPVFYISQLNYDHIVAEPRNNKIQIC